jgi:RNA polymerase sigma factor (sigma-70 family)
MATGQTSEVLQSLRTAVLLRGGAGLTDGQLLDGFVSRREEAALAALVRRHGPMVWGVCRRVLRNYHDAEDAFQATFLVLLRQAASIASPELLANWLYGVAHQTALKARATTARRRARERQGTEMPEPAVTEQDLWHELQPLLDQELSRLPDRYRVAIVLCDLEGKTRKEAARQLGVPEGTLAARLARGRVLLAKRLARHGLTVSSASLATVLAQSAASARTPAPVVSFTIKAATSVAAGGAATSAEVAALAEGVVKAMFLTKLKVATLLLMLVTLFITSAGSLGYPSRAAETSETDKEEKIGELHSFTGHSDAVPSVAVAQGADGLLALSAGRSDNAVRVWDLSANKQLRAFEGHTEWVWSVALSRDGKRALSGGVDGVRLWEVATGKELHHFNGHERQVYRVALSAAGRRALSASQDRTVRLWDCETGAELHCFKGHADEVVSVAFSPDGKLALSCSVDHITLLWDLATGKEVRRFAGGRTAAFSPDGRTILSGGRVKDLQLWDVKTGKELRRFEGHTDEVSCVAFSPNGKRALSGGNDNTMRLWDIDTGKELHCFTGHTGEVSGVAFSPDGKRALSGSYDQTMRLWKLAE